ncbi:Rossmann fold domain-containing protein [Novosphingobium sp. BL-8A]|uniref:Rossmann fold domain-containing protein n=1 Tax=Novosphingobium sp. BL-8A TaxID=3127639 RepID=UPI003757AF47
MILRVGPLADSPLDAAAQFHADVLPRVGTALAEAPALTLVFAAADHTHRGWRLAAVQALARDYAPARINGLEGDDPSAIDAAAIYLSTAEGVTGQLLRLDGIGAGAML